MSRRSVLSVVELVLVTCALSAAVYIVAEACAGPGVPSASRAASAALMALLALVAAATVVAVAVAVQLEVPPAVRRWRGRRAARRRHAARIGARR